MINGAKYNSNMLMQSTFWARSRPLYPAHRIGCKVARSQLHQHSTIPNYSPIITCFLTVSCLSIQSWHLPQERPFSAPLPTFQFVLSAVGAAHNSFATSCKQRAERLICGDLRSFWIAVRLLQQVHSRAATHDYFCCQLICRVTKN